MEESTHIVFDEANDLPTRKREGTDDASIIEDEMKKLIINDSNERNKE